MSSSNFAVGKYLFNGLQFSVFFMSSLPKYLRTVKNSDNTLPIGNCWLSLPIGNCWYQAHYMSTFADKYIAQYLSVNVAEFYKIVCIFDLKKKKKTKCQQECQPAFDSLHFALLTSLFDALTSASKNFFWTQRPKHNGLAYTSYSTT